MNGSLRKVHQHLRLVHKVTIVPELCIIACIAGAVEVADVHVVVGKDMQAQYTYHIRT